MIRLQAKKTFTENGQSFELDIDLEIPSHEFVNLYGRSGAGKTTTLRMLAGLTHPDEGRIQVDDEIWFDSSRGINRPTQDRSIGFVFQDYALFPNMTLRRNLEFAAGPGGQHQAVNHMIEHMDLVALAERKPMTLSGGQKQRLAVARALMRQPKILLLDEPLSALDSDTRQLLADKIQTFHQSFAMTSLMVSHSLAEIFRMCHRMIVIEEGRIVKTGTPSDVFIAKKMSGKFKFEGEILEKQKSDVVYILTIAIGSNMVKVIATEEEAEALQIGAKILVASKAFNPILIPLERPGSL